MIIPKQTKINIIDTGAKLKIFPIVLPHCRMTYLLLKVN